MPFPVVVGNKSFTLADFEGRNYVYGYPALLEAFANRDLGGDSAYWLDLTFVVPQNLALKPSWGPITIPTISGFIPTRFQTVVVKDSQNSCLMAIQVISATASTISGTVCYVSENFTRPVTSYRLGLAQVFRTNPPEVSGSLERLPEWLDDRKTYGAPVEVRMMGAYTSIERFDGNATYGPSLITNADGGSLHAANNVEYVEWAGAELPLRYPTATLIWRFRAKSSGLKCILHPSCVLTKSGASILVNGTSVAGTYFNTVYHTYEFRMSMASPSSGSIEVWLNGTLVRTVSISTPVGLGFRLEGPFEAVGFSLRAYHV